MVKWSLVMDRGGTVSPESSFGAAMDPIACAMKQQAHDASVYEGRVANEHGVPNSVSGADGAGASDIVAAAVILSCPHP